MYLWRKKPQDLRPGAPQLTHPGESKRTQNTDSKKRQTNEKDKGRNNTQVWTQRRSVQARKEAFRKTAQETIDVLPDLLKTLKISGPARKSAKLSLENLPRLDPYKCPRYPQPAMIRVVREDTLNAAMALIDEEKRSDPDPRLTRKEPAVMNFANRHAPGGGWINGAMAQEEAICFRSSLYLSLHPEKYPLARGEGIYSPLVLIIRNSVEQGHRLLFPQTPVQELPRVAAITISALYRPKVRSLQMGSREPKDIYARNEDRNGTKDKMRLALRMAAFYGHRMLVLGAFGCGVYGNPPEDVAHCWLEVLREDEFTGNWWRSVCFAVHDPKNDGNFETFARILAGHKV